MGTFLSSPQGDILTESRHAAAPRLPFTVNVVRLLELDGYDR